MPWGFFSKLRAAMYYTPAVEKGNLGATPTFDLSAGNIQYGTLNANVTAITLSNPYDGQRILIGLTQNGTGSWTVAGWPSTIDWAGGSAPTQTPTALKRDNIALVYRASTGRYDGAYSQNH